MSSEIRKLNRSICYTTFYSEIARLILKMIEKMEIQKEHFLNRVEEALNARVKVQGGQPYIGQYLNKTLVSAEDEAKAMGDEYVSVEHLFLSIAAESQSVHEEAVWRIWNYPGSVPAGSEHCEGKSACDHGQPGKYL